MFPHYVSMTATNNIFEKCKDRNMPQVIYTYCGKQCNVHEVARLAPFNHSAIIHEGAA